MEDKKIVCRNCGTEFIFTVGEQKFYEEKGFAEPVRCKECRNKRKAEKEQSTEKTEQQKKDDFYEITLYHALLPFARFSMYRPFLRPAERSFPLSDFL